MKLNEKIPSRSPITYHSLDLREFEHIEFLSCSYSQSGIISFFVKTNTSRYLKAEGKCAQKSDAVFTREINMRPLNKALLGFRGLFCIPEGSST